MQLSLHLRRFAAIFPLVLAGLAAPGVAAELQTQAANLLPVITLSTPPEGVTNWARQVRSDLLLASDNNIYFASVAGGEGTGAVAKLTPEGTLTTLKAFDDGGDDGVSAFGSLIQASDGNLYGTLYLGGEEGGGTLYRLTLAGELTVLHHFGGGKPNAILPYTGVTEGSDGNLYGTTFRGGPNDAGVVYRIGKDGTGYTVLHNFGGSSGENPEGKLALGLDGWLYGTTMMGGANNRGTIYRISNDGTHEVLYSFPRLGDFNSQGLATNSVGSNPRAGLLAEPDGTFLGTAYQGGTGGWGTVYRYDPAADDIEVVHAFAGPSHGGGYPLSSLVRDADGNLYGTTERGGALNRGSAWRISPDGTFTLLHGFIGLSDGVVPYAGLLPAHGRIYGVSQYDLETVNGSSGYGTIFTLDLGAGGTLPVQLTTSATRVMQDEAFTISWNAPAGATCTKVGGPGAWTGEPGVSGSQTLRLGAGVYPFGLRCQDADDGDEATPRTTRLAIVTVEVDAPLLQPLDGGGGGGSLSLWWLLLAASLLFRQVLKENRSPCP